MSVPTITAIILATIVAMELIAWAVHRYVMHGFGWAWHRSHHEPDDKHLEKNDLYAVIFGGLALLLILLGTGAASPLYWVGVGMSAYGLLYFLVHDGLVHQRIPFPRKVRSAYLKRLVQAHRLHHAVKDREGSVSYGFLYAPPVQKLRAKLREGADLRR